MVESGSVETQIIDYYGGCYIEFDKLISYLKDDKIDRAIPSAAMHNGFDEAEDFAIFYYPDCSVLVVSRGGVESFRK